MKKKFYVRPAMEVELIAMTGALLVGSDPNNVVTPAHPMPQRGDFIG